MSRGMRPRLLTAYLTGQALALAVFPLLAAEGWARPIWQLMVAAVAALFLVVGVHKHRPPGATAYWLFAAAVLLNGSGVLVEAILIHVLHNENTPSAADLFWLSVYPGVIAGITLLIRRRRVGRDRAMALDTTIIAVGVGLLAWVFVIRPHAVTNTPVLERVVTCSYPIGDLLALTLMVRLLLGGEDRPGRSFTLTVAALLCLLAGDLGWITVTALGRPPEPWQHTVLSMFAITAYILLGASALDPSVREVARPVERSAHLSRILLLGLTTASLVAPALLALQTWQGRITDGVAIALTSATLFLLVVTRMSDLLRHLEERRRELDQRNRAARLVLDTIDQGLLRVFDDGTMAEERSAMIDRWLGPFDGRPLFDHYIRRVDPIFAASFSLGQETLLEGVMPAEVILAQLPGRLGANGRELAVRYLQVAGGGLLLVMTDVTQTLQLSRQEAEQRELLALVQGWSRDRVGLLALIDEASGLLERAASAGEEIGVRQRCIHTVKGNAGQVGLNVVADLCHAAEDELAEQGAAGPALEALLGRFASVTAALDGIDGGRGRELIEIDGPELEELCRQVSGGLPAPAIVSRLSAWRCEPVERALERLAGHARALARKLGKGDLHVAVDGGGLRLDNDRWSSFWAEMVHVVNNAVDHGLENPAERAAAGKPARPRLRLAALVGEGELTIEIEDDGRGVDWQGVARSAAKRGLPAATSAELTAALFSPGVSSREEVTGISGRGVGMSAVRARVEARQGRIALTSQPGRGTSWRFSFPLETLGPYERAGALRALDELGAGVPPEMVTGATVSSRS